MSRKLVFVGDVHGNMRRVETAISKHTDSLVVQVGDFSISKSAINDAFSKYGPDKLVVVGGNHDNYDEFPKHPNYLGDYGWIVDGVVGFCRGAYSIDKHLRTPGFDYWYNEELNFAECDAFLNWYEANKPKIMVSHASPIACTLKLMETSRCSYTERMLQEALHTHQPDMWIHGHLHVQKRYKLDNFRTKFVSLGIDEIFNYGSL